MTGSEASTLWVSFARRATLAGERPALSHQGATWSYAAMAHAVERMADALHALGVRKGERVGFLAFNCPECLFTLLACARIGAIFVPLNFRLTAAELKFLIVDAQVHTLVVGQEHLELIDLVRAELPCQQFVHLGDDGPVHWKPLDRVLESITKAAPHVDVAPGDVATLVYTSGTTGLPKGAMLTHANLWANNLNWILAFGVGESDTVLTMAPMFHVSGLFVLLSAVLLVGGHVILHRAFEAGAVLSAIESHRVTLTFSVPTMLLMLSQHPEFDSCDLSSLRLMVVGGAPSPESLLRRYGARKIPLSHAYGMSECVSLCTFLEPASAMAKLNSAGRAVPLSEVRLIDPDGRVIAQPGSRGEICVRGETVMAGYWNRPDATATARADDGWLRTGDIGHVDEDGYLYVVDRLKDMIISGGENVYPAEVESALREHPAIANAAVIGRPDVRWGELVCAVVTLKSGNELTLDELQAFCHHRLARYKIPKEMKVVSELPLSGAGKVLKQVLRRELQ